MRKIINIKVVIETEDDVKICVYDPNENRQECSMSIIKRNQKKILKHPISADEIVEFISSLIKDGKSYMTKEIFNEFKRNYTFCDHDRADDGTMIRWKHKVLSSVFYMKRDGIINKKRGIIEKSSA